MKQFSSNLHTENSNFRKQYCSNWLLLSFTAIFLFSFLISNGQTNPTVTINQSGPDPTNLAPINFTVVFDQPVIGFNNAGVTLSGTAGATTKVVTGGPTTYNVAVAGMISCGTVIANIPAGVVTNALSQPNLASTSIDNTVTYSNVASTVNPVPNQQLCAGSATNPINFTGTPGATFAWVNSTPSIGLSASGSGNITSFTAFNTTATAVTATITVTPSIGACAGTPISFTITVNPLPAVVATPNTTCVGPCASMTASGADTYSWSPIAGLYINCPPSQPYVGSNISTVYTPPGSSYVYQVTGTNVITGCMKTVFATPNYTPLAPVVVPTSVNMCLGDAGVKIKVATVSGTQFCSGPVNIAVPDNNPAGATSNITVSGITAGTSLSRMWVTINMQHTRIGNMVFVLKAPNGAVLNLDYHLGATGGTGSTTGFNNTIISSLGGADLSVGTNPFTATFKPDAQATAAGGFGANGPTGMLQTVNNWASLAPTAAAGNGTWTLGFYDGVTGDVGTLNSWCLNFAFTNGGNPPVNQAIWSPATGLFLDPFGVIPYIAGTARDSVYARPTPAGVYTYQVTTQGLPPATCPSPPTTVLVTVSQPYSINTQPVNQTVCVNGVAVFTAGATGTGPATFQWQVSTDGGLNFNNTNNAAPYSGGTTATLVINPVSAALNGYLFRLSINGGSGSCSTTSSAALLTVGQAFSITTQPANQTLCGSGVAVFTVGVTGTGPFTYQWQVSTNGGAAYTNIVNAAPYSGVNTATLTINPATVAMNGYLYKVAINGGCSVATSSAALLTVAALPTIVITANPLVIGPAQTTTIHSTVTPNPAATYTWYYGATVIPAATADTLLVNYGAAGDYQLKVTDINGCTNLSNIITIANSFSFNLLTYPNPSGGRFQVRYNSPANNPVQRSLLVYNNHGELVITKNFTQTIPYQKVDVDVRANGKGLYWIELRDAYGRRLALSRVVVQ